MNKENEKIFAIIAFFLMVITIILSFMNTAFLSACMTMTSLFIFSICYIIRDSKKKLALVLFVLGVLLIITSLIYTYIRIYHG